MGNHTTHQISFCLSLHQKPWKSQRFFSLEETTKTLRVYHSPGFSSSPGARIFGLLPMDVSARRAANAFHLLPIARGFALRQPKHGPPSQGLIRRIASGASSEYLRSSGSCSVMESSGFRRWRNGGGLFHKFARVDPTTLVEIGAVVHPDSIIEANVHVGSGTVVGPSVFIGHSTKIGCNVALSNCSVGDSCIIHHGACIGQDGFGFFVDKGGHVVKKPQMLQVKIGNSVEIGANTCIDRGSWRDTVIGDHTKIDNLVQIGHNVAIGKCCILCGQVGIAGSVTIGNYVTMGGRAMVRDHVSITSEVRIAANSGVTKNIATSGDYGGFPAVPIREWHRQAANIRKICKENSQS